MSSLLVDLIKSYAERFILGFRPDDLNINLWQGVSLGGPNSLVTVMSPTEPPIANPPSLCLVYHITA